MHPNMDACSLFFWEKMHKHTRSAQSRTYNESQTTDIETGTEQINMK